MKLLQLKMESRKAQSQRKILFALSLVDNFELAYTKLLQQTGLSRSVLSTHLDELAKQGLIIRIPIIKEDAWPPSVYYKLTEKGIAELVKRQIIAHVAHGKTEIKSTSFYLHLTDVLTGIFFKEKTKKWWEKLLRLIPEFLSKKLDVLDYERMGAFMEAIKKASIIADCLDIFVYSERPFNFDPIYWPRAYEWICKLFQEKLDHPEEVGNYVIAITFDGDKARKLDKTRSEGGALFDYFERMGYSTIRPGETPPKEEPKAPKPSCFKDLRKLPGDAAIPDHCLACEWILKCSK
jgi:DNA-binding transcriptional ArsR family regulator